MNSEERVRAALTREFGMPFEKKVIYLGKLAKEFDAVSTNGEIIGIVDYAWLARTTGKTKLLVFVEKGYAEWFRPYCEFLFPNVVIRWMS